MKPSSFQTDSQAYWDVINQEAFEHSLRPVALPQRDNIPFWNRNARQFIMPPAFEAPSFPGASTYQFVLKATDGTELASFRSASPQDPLTPVWDKIPVGDVSLTISALDENGAIIKEIFQRNFYRCAWFHGPYPSLSHDYLTAGQRCLSYIFHLPHIQAWLDNGTVDEKIYRKYCYPSKTLSAIIRAVFLYADIVGDEDTLQKAKKIASKMADWLIDNSCPAGTKMEYLPPTYWKYATYHLAKPHIGQIMMIYPTCVGNAYLNVYEKTGEGKYLDAAVRLGNTMKQLELPGGSWCLKLREEDGAPLVENVVLLTADMYDFFTRLSEKTGNESFIEVRDRAYQRLLNHNLKLWDWDGQFEDVIPTSMYTNLTKNHAMQLAANFLKEGKIDTALQIVDWTEDQFVVWSNPSKALQEASADKTIVLPTALEQYNCYWPVDASMANFIQIWTKIFLSTGNRVYLEKAKALADAIIRNQREDGSIPTWFMTIDLPDWLNCMAYSASCLLELGKAESHQ